LIEIMADRKKRRTATRTRNRNFKQPDEAQVASSVESLIDDARNCVNVDHHGTIASDRERDQLATIYLGRAHATLLESLE
jgi:hypothetical protein